LREKRLLSVKSGTKLAISYIFSHITGFFSVKECLALDKGRNSSVSLVMQLRGAAMLNIRINFTIDVKKVAVTMATAVMVWGQMFSPAHALPAMSFDTVQEKPVTVSLQYLTVTTTRSDAKKALASTYSKYFDPQTLAFLTEYSKGAPMAQWKCLNSLWMSESHFNPKALNMGSHAFGIAQFLPTTWGNYDLKKTSVASLQIKYGLHYIQIRYGDPCNAWKFWQKNQWY